MCVYIMKLFPNYNLRSTLQVFALSITSLRLDYNMKAKSEILHFKRSEENEKQRFLWLCYYAR